MYWDAKLETLNQAAVQELQLSRLRQTVERAAASPFYGRRFKEAGVAAANLRSLEDIRRIPFTTKDDLRTHGKEMLTRPLADMVRLHASSGTTGQATVIYYTRADIETWADLVARSLYMTGMRAADVFQNMMGYGLFTGGLGFHYGAERLGALTIPVGAGNSQRQLQLMQQFATTAIHIIPSYALYLLNTFAASGLDPRDLPLRLAFLGAEPHSEDMRRRIEAAYGVKAYNSYGLSEMNGPGVAFECPEQNGLHVWEDAFLLEVLDPETLEPAPPGEVGELVFTNLTRQGMPLLRYRTRDLASYDDGALRLRPQLQTPVPDHGAHRRHGDHQRGQHLPPADRQGAHGHAGGGHPVPGGIDPAGLSATRCWSRWKSSRTSSRKTSGI